MAKVPQQVSDFLAGNAFAVAGVSRSPAAANAIFRKLKNAGRTVYAINPNATTVDGEPCYPNVRALPEPVDSVVISTHPSKAIEVVRECAEAGVKRVWFHRSFGEGSVSNEAVTEAQRLGIDTLVGGCPMMYCEPVDLGHRCFRWILKLQHRVPA